MTNNTFIKCDICDTKIRLRWQVGYNKALVSILCPKCKCTIECELKAEIIGPSVVVLAEDLQGAKQINDDDADYCQEISTEFFTTKMIENSKVSIISPFIRQTDLFFDEDNRNYVSKIITVSEDISIYKKELQQISSLYSNKSFQFMKNKFLYVKDALMLLFKKKVKNSTLQNDSDYHKYYYEYCKFGLKDIISDEANSIVRGIICNVDVTNSKNRFGMKEFATKLNENDFYNENRDRFINLTIDYLNIFKALIPVYVEHFDLSNVDLKNDGMTTISYSKLENIYKKCYEFFGHNCLLLIGLNNLFERGDMNNFSKGNDDLFNKVICSGSKYRFFKDNIVPGEMFSDYFVDCLDNVIRNSEAHFSTSYDIITQEITFKNINNKGKVTISKKYLASFANDVAALYFKCYALWCISSKMNEIYFKDVLGLKCKFELNKY